MIIITLWWTVQQFCKVFEFHRCEVVSLLGFEGYSPPIDEEAGDFLRRLSRFSELKLLWLGSFSDDTDSLMFCILSRSGVTLSATLTLSTLLCFLRVTVWGEGSLLPSWPWLEPLGVGEVTTIVLITSWRWSATFWSTLSSLPTIWVTFAPSWRSMGGCACHWVCAHNIIIMTVWCTELVSGWLIRCIIYSYCTISIVKIFVHAQINDVKEVHIAIMYAAETMFIYGIVKLDNN